MNNLMSSTMFLMNESIHQNASAQSLANAKRHETPPLFNISSYEKSCNLDAANSFFRSGMFAADKHFLAPRGHIQFSTQECGDVFLKRAAGPSTSSNSDSVLVSTQHLPQRSAGNKDEMSLHKYLGNNATKESQTAGGSPSSEEHEQPPKLTLAKERPFVCLECGKSFLLKHHLVTHTRVHSGERPHVCRECGKNFAHKHCLTTHLLLHTTQRPYKCGDCKKSFTLKHHLVTHARVHSRDRPFHCQECGKAFPQKRHLVTHGKFHSGERPYVCAECNESFSQKEHLVTHSRFHGCLHPYVCPDCGVAFLRKFELVNHGRLHGREPHSCTVCGKEFLQKRTLLAHARLHLEEEHQSYECQQCTQVFNNKLELTQHTVMHTHGKAFLHHSFPTMSPHFLCPPPTKAPIMTSAAVQTDIMPKPKPHVCNLCGKCFSQKHGLAQHNKRHGINGGCEVRSHICDKCGKGFLQKNHLALHYLQHRTDDQLQIKTETFKTGKDDQEVGVDLPNRSQVESCLN